MTLTVLQSSPLPSLVIRDFPLPNHPDEAFRSCLESGKHKPAIQNDMQVASSLQIQATPSFLIGKTTGEEVSGTILIGAQPFSAFEVKLKEAEAAQ